MDLLESLGAADVGLRPTLLPSRRDELHRPVAIELEAATVDPTVLDALVARFPKLRVAAIEAPAERPAPVAEEEGPRIRPAAEEHGAGRPGPPPRPPRRRTFATIFFTSSEPPKQKSSRPRSTETTFTSSASPYQVTMRRTGFFYRC